MQWISIAFPALVTSASLYLSCIYSWKKKKKKKILPLASCFPLYCLISPVAYYLWYSSSRSWGAGSIQRTSEVTFEILESRGNQLSVSVWVTVSPEKIIQLSGDDLLEFGSIHECFLFSSFFSQRKFWFKNKHNKTSSCYRQMVAFTKK